MLLHALLRSGEADSNPGWTLRVGSGRCLTTVWHFSLLSVTVLAHIIFCATNDLVDILYVMHLYTM